MKVVGVDGCQSGWVAVSWDVEGETVTASVHATIPEVFAAHADAAVIAIDMPIGLREGPRQCDVLARKMLRWKHSSVFPAPDPRLIRLASYEEAGALSRELTEKGLSKQSFAIFPKIVDVNDAMTPELQGRVIEVHPEVSFCAMAGEPMKHPKRDGAGIAERRVHLKKALGIDIWTREQAARLIRPAKADDLYDAVAAAWSAKRAADDEAVRMPEEPELGEHGLRMEIVY